MLNRLKHLLKSKRQVFAELCSANELTLNFDQNKSELKVLEDIFKVREYADYFPFYKHATVVDVGAHYGYFSLFAAANTASSSKIVAIEPSPSNFKQLKQNLRDNQVSNVKICQSAIGGKTGEVALFEGKNSNHSIVDGNALANRKSGGQKVAVKTLETLLIELAIDHVDFLKMDCEGAEYEIFGTLPAHVFDRISTISMEFHDLKDSSCTAEVLIDELKAHSFEIVKYAYGATSMNLNYGRLVATKMK